MSVQPPPYPDVNSFNNQYWVSTDSTTGLTLSQAQALFLQFPVAQGTETLQVVKVTDEIIFSNGSQTNTLNLTAQNNLSFTSSFKGAGIELSDPNTNQVVLSVSDWGLVCNKSLSVSNGTNDNYAILQADKTNSNQLNILGSSTTTAGNLYVSGIATMGTVISTDNSNNTTFATTAFVTSALSNVVPQSLENYAELSNTTSQLFSGDNVFSLYPTITADLPVSTTNDNQIATTAFVQSVVSSISPVTPVTGQAFLADSTDSTTPQTFTGYNQFNQDLNIQGILQYNNQSAGEDFILNNTNYYGNTLLNFDGNTIFSANPYYTNIFSYDTSSPNKNHSLFSAAGLSIQGNYGLNISSYGNGLQNSGYWGFNPLWSATETVYPPHFNFETPQITTPNGSGTHSPQYNFYSWNGTSQVLALAINAGGIQYLNATQTSSISPNVSTTQINANGDYELSVTTVDDFGGDVVINGSSWRQTLGDLNQAKQDLQTAQKNITELQEKMNYLYKTFFHI